MNIIKSVMRGRYFFHLTSSILPLPSYLFLSAALLAACSSDIDEIAQEEQRGLRITTSVNAFVGEGDEATRTNLDGTAFAVGDRIKLKIICPYSGRTQFGETTYSNTFDGLWLMKWMGSKWAMIEAKDSVDVAAQYKYSGAYSLFGQVEAQQTPYVYTASTWNENVLFLAQGNLQSQYSYIFRADQTLDSIYRKNDLLWAQTYMQTGSYDVHLSFNHVMACLKIDISALGLSNTIVTLEGMPDIDQREVVVGDYYAAASKVNSGKYGYQSKCSCSKENNGKVLGVAVIDDHIKKQALVYPMTGNVTDVATDTTTPRIDNTGVYTAYYNSTDSKYYLIVPPCTLSTQATLWVRGEKTVGIETKAMRYSYPLQLTTFEQGKRYTINVSLPAEP